MIEIHWILIIAIASVSACCGFFLCALLTMGKRSDELSSALIEKEQLCRIIEHKDRKIIMLETQLQNAGTWIP